MAANKYNAHTPTYQNTKVVAGPKGILIGGNHNIQRGGGYGFDPKGLVGFGRIPTKSYSNCGTGVKVQRGGGKACCAGTPYYGFTGADSESLSDAGVNNYPPMSKECHSQCGGTRRRRRRQRRRRKKNKRRTRRRRRSRRRGGRRVQKGGYAQYGSNTPSTPGYATPNGGDYMTANPATFARINACGGGSCTDNYNHFKKMGSATSVFDGDVSPTPKGAIIKTTNNKVQCGGRRRSRRRSRRRRRRSRRSRRGRRRRRSRRRRRR